MPEVIFKASTREQKDRLIAVICLGLLQAIERGAVTADDAEDQMWLPWSLAALQAAGCGQAVLHLVERCFFVDDVRRLVPERFEATLTELQQAALDILRETPNIPQDMSRRWLQRSDA